MSLAATAFGRAGTEIDVDLFAGGGGASEGMEQATGEPVAVAINHDHNAILTHETNHPRTVHFHSDVFEVDPITATRGHPVRWLWASPDCTHHSKAKGGKPRSKKLRALANVVVDWARAVRPRGIFVENVEEFRDNGPLDDRDQPIAARKGEDFRAWVAALEALRYTVEHRVLCAADYGAPTLRHRLVVAARRDGPIEWPESTHGPGCAHPYRTAAECIDWTIPCHSIFLDRPTCRARGLRIVRPLAADTLARIAEGTRRYVLEDPDPFLVAVPAWPDLGGRSRQCAAWLMKYYGGVIGHDLKRPIGTITTVDHHAVVVACLSKFHGTARGADLRQPMPTVLAQGNHLALHVAMLIKYYGAESGQHQSPRDPLHTIPTRDRFGLVIVRIAGEPYVVDDIAMRMLEPSELLLAQGFPRGYVLSGTKADRLARIGNSVPPPLARAVIAANHNAKVIAA